MWPTQTVRRNGRNVFDNPLSVFSDEFSRALNNWRDANGGEGLTGVYPVDIHEDADHLYVDAELPGFASTEVDVTLENGMLHIQAAHKDEVKPKGETHLHERRFTRVARSFTIPNTFDANKVEARMENGVLHLTLNKREEVKPRKIEIK